MAQIDLTWVDQCPNETGFEVERSPNGTTGWALIASPAANAESYSDMGLAASTTYYYRVRAKRGAERSAYTNVASATTPAGSVGLLLRYEFTSGSFLVNSGTAGTGYNLSSGDICSE